jgi:hypothetical protein
MAAPPTLSPDGIEAIRRAASANDARLIVIDPLNNHIPARVDPFKDHEVRRVMRPLADLARETGAAVVIVRHLKKGEGSALHRGGGSMGIIGAARSGLLVGPDPNIEGGRIIAGTKCNVAAIAPSVRFRVVDHEGTGRIEWGEVTNIGANEIAATGQTRPTRSKEAEAIEALREALAAGPRMTSDVLSDLTEAGFAGATIRRASKTLGVRREQSHGGEVRGWRWTLPPDDHTGG